MVLGPVNGDGRHLPGHERLEHGRLVRVVVRPELFAADHRPHVVPEFWRPVQHVAPPDAHAGQRHAVPGREVREEAVEELLVAHQLGPRDRPLDPVRGHAVADGRPAAEPRVLDAAGTGTAGDEASAAAGAASAQDVGDPFHDACTGSRGPGRRTGRAGRGTAGSGRRRFVGRPQRQPVDAFRQFGAGTFHDALTGHGGHCGHAIPTPLAEIRPVTARCSRRRGGDGGASDAPSTLKTARRGTFARTLSRRRCPRGGVRSVLGNRRRRRRRRRYPSANANPTPRLPPVKV